MRFTSPTGGKGKAASKVCFFFTVVNCLSTKDLIEVERRGWFRGEAGSADISALADISAQILFSHSLDFPSHPEGRGFRACVKTQPSPHWGRGWPAAASSSAGAGRVRGSQPGSIASIYEVFTRALEPALPVAHSKGCDVQFHYQSTVVSSKAICYGSPGDSYLRGILS